MLVDSFPISNKGYMFSSICYISAALHGAKDPNTSTNLRHKHIRACQDTHNALALGRLSILHGSPCVFLAHHDTRGFLHQSVWNQLRPRSITPFFLTTRTLENRWTNKKQTSCFPWELATIVWQKSTPFISWSEINWVNSDGRWCWRSYCRSC